VSGLAVVRDAHEDDLDAVMVMETSSRARERRGREVGFMVHLEDGRGNASGYSDMFV
jgi:hypothetical protein